MIVRPKTDYFMKFFYEEQYTNQSAVTYQKTLAFCTTQTNQLMIYVINNRESTYENALRISFCILRTKDISWIPKTCCIINV